MDATSERYLDLLKKSLLNEIYIENELRIYYLCQLLAGARWKFLKLNNRDLFEKLHHIAEYCPDLLHSLKEGRNVGLHIEEDMNHLVYSHTMVGRWRLENIDFCLGELIKDGVPGDLVECGVWQGGCAIFMKGWLQAHQIHNRKVWLADSYEGLPKPSYKEDRGIDISKEIVPGLAVSLENVKENFRKYDLMDEQVIFVKGWFKDTLSTMPVRQIALLRLDADLYESTMQSLSALYSRVVPGGYVIVDDYGAVPACKAAVDEFRQEQAITSQIHEIDWSGVFWRK